jgi:hypothetical protein
VRGLAQRISPHQQAQLADQPGVPAEAELQFDPPPDGGAAVFLQDEHARPERVVVDVAQRGPAPQRGSLP